MATRPSGSAVVLEQLAFDSLYGRPGEGGVEPARQHQEGLHAWGFQGTITYKVTDAVVLGLGTTIPPPPRFTTPDTFVAGRHEDLPEPAAQLKRGLIWRWPDVERLGFGYQPF